MQLNSSNVFRARYEVLRGGGVVGQLIADGAAEVQCDAESDMVLSIKGTFERDARYNFLTDRLRPVVEINGEEKALGTYVVTTEEIERDEGREIVGLEGYSVLYLARRKTTETRLHFSAGENYISVVMDLLESAGIENVDAESTEYTLQTDREDWEIGTPVLDIVNTLLGEISYRKAFVNTDGDVVLRKYVAPTLSGVSHVYTEGEDSVIAGNYKTTSDKYEKANVFRLVCENPDTEETLVAVSENNSEESPFSTVHIGRVVHHEKVDNVPSLAALQEKANELRDRSMQETEELVFYTAINPKHEPHDTVAIHVGSASGIFEETGWKITLSAENDMEHTARRVIV